MYRKTPFNLEEAKAYIKESVTYWEKIGLTIRIIALANYAYNRRNRSATVSTAAKLKIAKKNLSHIDGLIGGVRKLDPNVNTGVYQAERDKLVVQANG